jgi:hypothetical protein
MRFLFLFSLLFQFFVVPGPNAPSATIPLYSDTLAAGWEDWSWGAQTHNPANSSPVHGGSTSLQIQFTGGYSGVQFGTNATPPSTAAVNTLEFWIHGGSSGGQTVHVSVSNDCSTVSQDLPSLAKTWTKVSVPLEGLGTPAAVKVIAWSNPSAAGQPVFYVDDVTLTSQAVTSPAVSAGPALTINAAAGRHAISPLIYGMNFPNEALASELKLPLQRWGGNSTTRYNYLNDTSNRASDWYFENIPNKTANIALLPEGSASNLFIEQGRRTATQTLLTVPLIGWTPKSREQTCGYSVKKYGAQQDTDPWATDCGKGVLSNGSNITANDPLDTSAKIDPSFVQSWIHYLAGKYGSAADGGVRFYDLDNEPMLWNSTHRDVHPLPVSYDELNTLTTQYAAAIKAADPASQTLGPVLWGWTAYFYSALDQADGGSWWNNPKDRLAHGNIPFVEWYLQQMQAYEQAHGLRLLDYLDLHIYPQAGAVFSKQAGDTATQQLRLRSTRSLWDTSYVDESWIGEPIYLIPRMKAWINADYPGTRTALSEYSWGAMCHINGALAQADVLGIFGREGLDLATLWDPPQLNEPGAYAFRMFLNADGSGAKFGETSVQATSGSSDQLSVFAAQRSLDGALTMMVINKTPGPLSSNLALSGFSAGASAKAYRYAIDHLDGISVLPNQAISPTGFQAVYPGNSITLYVIPISSGWHSLYIPKIIKH